MPLATPIPNDCADRDNKSGGLLSVAGGPGGNDDASGTAGTKKRKVVDFVDRDATVGLLHQPPSPKRHSHWGYPPHPGWWNGGCGNYASPHPHQCQNDAAPLLPQQCQRVLIDNRWVQINGHPGCWMTVQVWKNVSTPINQPQWMLLNNVWVWMCVHGMEEQEAEESARWIAFYEENETEKNAMLEFQQRFYEENEAEKEAEKKAMLEFQQKAMLEELQRVAAEKEAKKEQRQAKAAAKAAAEEAKAAAQQEEVEAWFPHIVHGKKTLSTFKRMTTFLKDEQRIILDQIVQLWNGSDDESRKKVKTLLLSLKRDHRDVELEHSNTYLRFALHTSDPLEKMTTDKHLRAIQARVYRITKQTESVLISGADAILQPPSKEEFFEIMMKITGDVKETRLQAENLYP